MDASDLTERIRIETPPAGEDALGQDDGDWLLLDEVWAKAIEGQGREFLKGGYEAEEKAVFVIRWQEVDSTMRTTWNGRVYGIDQVTGTHHGGWAWLHCTALKGAN